MKCFRLVAVLAVVMTTRAAVPAPPQLFPQDTLVLLTVPDWNAARASMETAPLGRLWADPVMKPFRDKFEAGFRQRFLAALDKDLGLKAEDYLPLLQGQVSLAALKAGWNPADVKTDPTLVLLVDTRDKADELKGRLTEIRQKLIEAKRTVRSEKIRDVEFTTLVMERAVPASPKPDAGSDPDDDAEAKAEAELPSKLELTFGQVDTALVVATATAGLDRIVARLTGGAVPTLGETAEFPAAEAVCEFRGAAAYGFVQAGAVVEALQTDAAGSNSEDGGFGLQPKQLVAAAGLDGLRSLSASVRQSEAGLMVRFLAGVPESKRSGLVQLLRFEAKDASPPPFVPADAAEFQRVRLNGQQLWAGVEGLLQKVSPQINTVLMMAINSLGKDRDPDFDFQKMFFGNLGDDLVSYSRAPRGKVLNELQNPPSITLVGAVNANEMLAALRALAGLLPGGPDDLKEREVQGRKILSVKRPAAPNQPAATLEIAAGGGYVAFATDPAILEEFLRSADGSGPSLKDLSGLAEAAQQVGGMTTGVFSFQNQRQSAAGLWEALRTGGGLSQLMPPVGNKQVQEASSWLDFTVLPPFEQISRYLGINVSSGAWDSQGFIIRSFTPAPK